MNILLLQLFSHAAILLQTVEVNPVDITSLMSARDLTVNGLLLVAIIMLWRRLNAAEEKIEQLRKDKDTDVQKYIELLTQNNKIIDDNMRMYQRVEKLFDKFDK